MFYVDKWMLREINCFTIMIIDRLNELLSLNQLQRKNSHVSDLSWITLRFFPIIFII